MKQGLIQIGFIAGMFYTLQNAMEKIIFNKTEGNVNDYFILRLLFMTLIFAGIYFLFPSLLSIMTDTKMDIINFSKQNWGLVLASACFVTISVYFMVLGLSKYDVSVFSPVYLITYLCLNICMGVFLFKESITLNKVVGLAFAIASIILFNLDTDK